jgi:hypothetical protein
MVMVLITAGGHALAARLLVYVTVFVTVLSGVDYFFGLRRHLRIASAGRPRANATD